jgi:hypothetical protein
LDGLMGGWMDGWTDGRTNILGQRKLFCDYYVWSEWMEISGLVCF